MARNMTPQFKPGTDNSVQSEPDLVTAWRRLPGSVLALRDQDRKLRFEKGAPALANTIFMAFVLRASAIAQDTSSHHTAIDLGSVYHHISHANPGNQNPGLDSHMPFVGLSLFR